MDNMNSHNKINLEGNNNNLTISSTNNIIVNAQIDTSIERLKKDFYATNFTQAINDLDSLMTENEHNPKVKYQLLIVKIDFLRAFRQMNDFKEYIELIENDYSEFIDSKFKELKLTLLALLGDDAFFTLSNKLRLETRDSKPQGHFDILFYLNSGDIMKAKEVFDVEIKNKKYQDSLILLGGHIYSSIFMYENNDKKYFSIADSYYKEVLIKGNVSFFDKMQIENFYAYYFLNNKIGYKNNDDNLSEYVNKYYNSLTTIIKAKQYFNAYYIDSLSQQYIIMLLAIDKIDEYLSFYEENKNKLSMKYYIQYCDVKGIDFNHQKIQNYIKLNFILDDLICYISLIKNPTYKDINIIISFIQKNKNYLYKHSLVIYFFVRGSILLKTNIDKSLLEYLEKNKFIELNILIVYMKWLHHNNKNIDDVHVKKLLYFAYNDNKALSLIMLDIVELLHLIGKRDEYLALAINKQDIFNNVIFKTLQICEKDENLLFEDFNKFTKDIKNKGHINGILGNIYRNYNKLNIAFDYYFLEFKNNNSLELMLVLTNLGLTIYNQSNEIFEENKQKEIFNCICSDTSKLEINDLVSLLRYSVDILKDTKQILPTLNHKLLSADIKNLDKELKMQLSNMMLYLLTIYNINNGNDGELVYDDNLSLTKDNQVYIKNTFTISNENKINFNLINAENNYYELIKYDDNYTKVSLFNKIVGSFIGHDSNKFVTTIMINPNSDKPFAEFLNILKENGNNAKDMFQKYSDGEKIGLYQLSGKEYEKYFHLIHRLIEDVSINFNGGNINYKDNSINKILTISSILFLNHIDQLDKVLKRDDVFVQRTLINWLQSYIHKLHRTEKIFSMSSDGENYYKHIENKEEINSVKMYLHSLANKIINSKNIIEDQFEVLPIQNAYQILAEEIGKQEYQAFAYYINHNYQIITEDGIYDMLFNIFSYDKSFISNSTVLLRDVIDYEDLRTIIIDLHSKNYKYLLDELYMERLESYIFNEDILDLPKEEQELIKIVYNYGWLDKAGEYYDKKFKVLYPLVDVPTKTFFDSNIEKIFNIVR